VSCFDWPRLLEHRFDGDLEAPREWPRARRHLESCEACRREAATVDPTLVFRHAAAWSPDPAEADAVRLAVRALRRTAALSASVAAGRSDSGTRRGRQRLVSAVLFALVLALMPGRSARRSVERAEPAPPAFAARIVPGEGLTAPAIEGVDRPQARVYEWAADDLSVVLVVDESLDV